MCIIFMKEKIHHQKTPLDASSGIFRTLPSYPSSNPGFLSPHAEVRTGSLQEVSVLAALYLWKQHHDFIAFLWMYLGHPGSASCLSRSRQVEKSGDILTVCRMERNSVCSGGKGVGRRCSSRRRKPWRG